MVKRSLTIGVLAVLAVLLPIERTGTTLGERGFNELLDESVSDELLGVSITDELLDDRFPARGIDTCCAGTIIAAIGV